MRIAMAANPSGRTDSTTQTGAFKGENLPVERVTFPQVQEFLNKLNARNDGFLFRLPTEDEWEFAARAGTTDQYAGSLHDMAWYNDGQAAARGTGNFQNENSPTGLAVAKAHLVATKSPNAWGIYDMRGNVAEWVQDFYDADARGGSFRVYPWLTRVSLRTVFAEDYEFNDLGFRVAREKR
jgi:formylglycine-generating enzyme required for sulfatase activity